MLFELAVGFYLVKDKLYTITLNTQQKGQQRLPSYLAHAR
jgi:hypothetical protein